jgi:hypothetical protein
LYETWPLPDTAPSGALRFIQLTLLLAVHAGAPALAVTVMVP